MAEEETPKGVSADLTMGRPAHEFPSANFPIVFADGVASYGIGGDFVKFYLYRADPNMFGQGGIVSVPFLQVAMPTSGFARTFVLFKRAIAQLIRQGYLSDEALDAMDRALDSINPTKGENA